MISNEGGTFDGFKSLEGGVNSGRPANSIPPNQVVFAVNTSFRGGYPQTRPSWIKRTLTFNNQIKQDLFEPALFQGAHGYVGLDGTQQIIASVAGRIWKINLDNTYHADDITPTFSNGTFDFNSTTAEQTWMEQAEEFLVIQNGIQSPLVYDGSILSRVDPSADPKGVPVGTAMAYHGGRLWVVRPGKKTFVAGNIVFGEGGTPTHQGRDSILIFSENDFLNGGGEFGIPITSGEIRAIKSIANIDTSLGQGSLQILAENAIFSVNAPFDRTTWQDLNYPIQTISLIGSGSQSPSVAWVNGDIWFRDLIGIRSFQMGRRDFATWVNTPLSSEIQKIMDLEDESLLEWVSVVPFDNRLFLTTCGHHVAGHGTAFRGLISLDFHNVSGISIRTMPAYDGLWTGLQFLQIVDVGSRLFFFALSPENKIELWEMTKDGIYDNGTKRIESYIETRSMGYEDQGLGMKQLRTGDQWYDEIRADTDFTVNFRPDQYPGWVQAHQWSVSVKNTTCLTECGTIQNLKPQYRNRQRIPEPRSAACNTKIGTPLDHGFEFQFQIKWTGSARLIKFRTTAQIVQEDPGGFCQPSEAEVDATGIEACDTGIFSYSSV